MAVDVASNCRNCETRCIPDWPIRPWPSQGSSASSASFLPSFLQEASPSCGELSKPRSFPSPSSPPSPTARARSAIARIEQPQPSQPRFLTVPSTGFVQGGLVIRAKGGDAILSAAGSARRAFGKSRDGTRGLWPLLPRSWKRDGDFEGGGYPSSIGDQCEKKFVRGRGEEELLELFEGVFRDGEIDYTNFVY